MAPGARRKLVYASGERASEREGAGAHSAPDPATAAPASLAAGSASGTVPGVVQHAPSAPGQQEGAREGRGRGQRVVAGGGEVSRGGIRRRRKITGTRIQTPRSPTPGPQTLPPTATATAPAPATASATATGRPAGGVAGHRRGGKSGGVKRPREEQAPEGVVGSVRGRKMRGLGVRKATLVERSQAAPPPPHSLTPATQPAATQPPATHPPATQPPATTTQPPTTLPTTTTTTTTASTSSGTEATTPKTFYGGKGGVKKGGRGKAVPVKISQPPPPSPRSLIGRPSQPATTTTTTTKKTTPSKFIGILFDGSDDEDANATFDHLETEKSGWARDVDSGDEGDHEDDHGALQQYGDEGQDDSDPDDPGFRAEDDDHDDDEGEDEGEDEVPRRPRRIPDVFREFEWSPCSEFEPELFDFSAAQSGLSAAWPCDAESQEADYFLAFFDGGIMDVIVEETNKYYQWVRARTAYIGPRSRFAFWQDCHVEEMLVFLALILLMPLCKKHLLRDYWKNDSLLALPVFGKFLARDRFLMLLSFLHFTDNTTPNRSDPIWKVRPILSRLTDNFRKYFYPFRKVVIDESLMLFKGRLAFKQYIPSKRHRFGVKLFVLCDCETGFILDSIVYSASDVDIPTPRRNDPLGLSGQIVKKMLEPYLGRGHTLYTDNWYTSPFLCQYLHQQKTGSCGTVKHTRKHMPRFPVDEREDLPHPSASDTPDTDDAEKLAAHQRRTLRRTRNPKSVNRQKSGKVLAVKWTDRRDVHLLSTVHQGKMVDSGATHWKTKKPIQKPDIVTDYTDNMRLVDKADCMLSGTECVRQSTKWYQKLFFHLVDLAMLNAYIAWLCATSDPVKPKPKFREFIHDVCYQLLERYGSVSAVATGRGRRAVARPDRIQQAEYISRHHLVKTPETEGGSRKHEQRRCAYCVKKVPPKVTRVVTMCPGCDVGLCMGECFVKWHTVKKL